MKSRQDQAIEREFLIQNRPPAVVYYNDCELLLCSFKRRNEQRAIICDPDPLPIRPNKFTPIADRVGSFSQAACGIGKAAILSFSRSFIQRPPEPSVHTN